MMKLGLLCGPCFGGYEIEYFSYELTIASIGIFIIIGIGLISLIRLLQKSALLNQEPSLKRSARLPGRDFLQLEKPYSHPQEVFVPFSTKFSKSPVIRAVVISVCLALVLFPLQLAL